MLRPRLLIVAGLLVVFGGFTGRGGAAGAIAGTSPAGAGYVAQTDVPQPPIDDPQALVAAYYQTLQDAVNSGDFSTLVASFTPDAGIDSDLARGGAAGTAQILAYFQKLPAMQGFTVETSNLVEADPYVDVDWRFRAAPGYLRGYLDGHDSFTIRDGLIAQLATRADPDAVAGAFMPPPSAPPPRDAPVTKARVTIENFQYTPAVIKVPAGATVRWTNQDADTHTVTTDDRTIDAGLVEEDVTVTLTFPFAGTYNYYCTIHPGMRGTVIVGGG